MNLIIPTLTNFSSYFVSRQIYISPSTTANREFFIPFPTSTNSIGHFTYISSNTNVATTAGRFIRIVGVGSSKITLIQAAYGNYASHQHHEEITFDVYQDYSN